MSRRNKTATKSAKTKGPVKARRKAPTRRAGRDGTAASHAILTQILEMLRDQQAVIERLVATSGASGSRPATTTDETVGAIPRMTLVPERAA